MLYTGKGDDGYTGIFGCDQRISKSATIAGALGSLDEANSLLGLVHVKLAGEDKFEVSDLVEIIERVQQDLFIAQAHLGGGENRLNKEHVSSVEEWGGKIETELPPIKNFIIPGGSETSALLDYARTVARRAERQTVAAHEEGVIKGTEHLLVYLNRLSSLLYALARVANHRAGVEESNPTY